MVSVSRVRSVPAAWRYALLGAVVSLPVSAVVDRLPNSEATVGAGIMVFGGFIAGVVAATRASDPGAAGLRAGVVGGVVGVTRVVVEYFGASHATIGPWEPSRIVPLLIAAAVFLALGPGFGLVFGRVGGWLTDAVVTRLPPGADASQP